MLCSVLLQQLHGYRNDATVNDVWQWTLKHILVHSSQKMQVSVSRSQSLHVLCTCSSLYVRQSKWHLGRPKKTRTNVTKFNARFFLNFFWRYKWGTIKSPTTNLRVPIPWYNLASNWYNVTACAVTTKVVKRKNSWTQLSMSQNGQNFFV